MTSEQLDFEVGDAIAIPVGLNECIAAHIFVPQVTGLA
ncbi:hypothetical protein Salmuc_03327 [Salipiger mucosus DSM 16094]|uniref:Uncharacterized protein n=1 Tax=Salipiger mucosus DSM 16094 TaxID=1123237 RepID=S9RIR5_9RHOB|nr:hypothetical protein Salmuc_03327 [Salipiger mucosus DSM 16094]